jgi:uncharacterized membrane protein
MIDKIKKFIGSLLVKLNDKINDFMCEPKNEDKIHLIFFTLPTIIAFAILSFIEPNSIYILAGAIIATIIIVFCFKFISLPLQEGDTDDRN